MPELPEVETTRRGLAPHLAGRRVLELAVREPRLRWPVAPELAPWAAGRRVRSLERRGKYLVLDLGGSGLLVHLGMSGSLRLVPEGTPAGRHAHWDLRLDDGRLLRFTDPRRFGSLHRWEGEPGSHPLLRALGPEPLGPDFHGDYLYGHSRGRRVPVKAFLMDARVVVGVGNIYANEALFLARLPPGRAAGRIGAERYSRLAAAVRSVLEQAIAAGGTTLRDFTSGDGQPGYFRQRLRVYGRGGAACPACGTAIAERRQGQRSTFFCPRCQRY